MAARVGELKAFSALTIFHEKTRFFRSRIKGAHVCDPVGGGPSAWVRAPGAFRAYPQRLRQLAAMLRAVLAAAAAGAHCAPGREACPGAAPTRGQVRWAARSPSRMARSERRASAEVLQAADGDACLRECEAAESEGCCYYSSWRCRFVPPRVRDGARLSPLRRRAFPCPQEGALVSGRVSLSSPCSRSRVRAPRPRYFAHVGRGSDFCEKLAAASHGSGWAGQNSLPRPT